MNVVKVIVSSSNSWFGRLVKFFTKSTVSHCQLEIPIWSRRLIVEVNNKGSRLVSRSIANKNRKVVCIWECTFDVSDGLVYVADSLGEDYDYPGIAYILWMRIVNMFSAKKSSIKYATKALKCSELAFLFFRSCHISVFPMSRETATPEDIRVFCTSNPALFKRVF